MAPPRKRFGQHFLFDPRLLSRIAEAVAPAPDETVLEIGPGPGGLTGQLLERAARLVAIEKDRDLVAALREHFPRLELHEGDALELDWRALVGPGPWVVTGNIPYNITSPLIELALTPPRPRRVVFLVQREVADRIAAPVDSGAYGSLSIGVRAVARAERLFGVPAGAFRPPPKVDSAVIRLTPLPEPLVTDAEVPEFRRFVVGLFGFRRKQLTRGLREHLDLTPEGAGGALAAAGIPPSTRPAELSPGQFVALFRAARSA